MKPKQCVVCGTHYTPKSWNPTMVPICSPACKEARRGARRKVVALSCVLCGVPVTLSGRRGLEQARTGRAYCSEAHKIIWRAGVASRTLAATNRRSASTRMRLANPMTDPIVRARMAARLREIGHRPLVRGGNGTGPTRPQLMLAAALGDGWLMECPVRLGPKRPGHPTVYKVDIGHPERMVAVEVDGASHVGLRREADTRKDMRLLELGWRVLRFSNERVTTNLADCVQEVLSTI